MDKSILQKINILYVEDEDEVRSLTVKVLAQLVHNITEAVNGKDGLEIFQKHNDPKNQNEPFDIIVTDINMPKMDGLQMLAEISKIDNSVPSIITTAHNDADFLKQAINQRVRGYVNKPLNLHDLIDSIIIAVEPKFLKDELININKNLESQVEEKTLELRSILDSQNSMIAVYNDKKITIANQTLLNFYGIKTIEEFEDRYNSIEKTFIDGKNNFSENWIDEIQKLDSINNIVKIKNQEDEEKIFQVNIRSFIYNTVHYVVSFNDVTELKQYTYKLQYQATHDNLTKLYNRQRFNDDLNSEIKRVERYNHTLSLLMFDIDDFKMINDQFGHDVGDTVLISISDILRNSIRSTDIPARWGGEEFMVLLPETSIEACDKVAQNLRKNIESFKFEGVDRTVTVSIGIVEYKDRSTKDTLIKNVDIALYQAKHNGKNQVIKYEE